MVSYMLDVFHMCPSLFQMINQLAGFVELLQLIPTTEGLSSDNNVGEGLPPTQAGQEGSESLFVLCMLGQFQVKLHREGWFIPRSSTSMMTGDGLTS